jgi:hypothetical protein
MRTTAAINWANKPTNLTRKLGLVKFEGITDKDCKVNDPYWDCYPSDPKNRSAGREMIDELVEIVELENGWKLFPQ